MTVYTRGMTASYVKKIQQALKDAGYDPGPIDGIFGSRTESAVLAYQRDKGLDPSGAVGTDMQKQLGLSTAGQSEADGDYTSDENTRFNGLAGKPEIWKDADSGKAYVVYFVPGTEPPIPQLWAVPTQEDLESFFGDATVKFDKTVTMEQIQSTGGVVWGSTDVLPELGGDPYAGFVERMNRAAETQPWLEDPDVFALHAAAWLEGREPERWELEATDWWQGHNVAQRDWMWAVARDPKEAERILEDNTIAVYSTLRDLGFTGANSQLVEHMALQVSKGDWSTAYLQEQINVLAGADGELDPKLRAFANDPAFGLGESVYMEDDVHNLFNTWLGPAFPPSDAQVSDWAGRLRTGGEAARDELLEHLRQQRLALFPEYENENLTYEDIASPWRSFASELWGQRMDETDEVFQKLLKLNDTTEGGNLLRQEGLKRGVQKVTQSALSGLSGVTGGMVRRAL